MDDLAKLVMRERSNLPDALTLPLADLVMMQMVGEFPSFLDALRSDHALALQMIEEVRSKATTPKLYTSIVDRTIEAQFGEKHATVRELGQNGLDSYRRSKERTVEFTTSHTDDHVHLRVQDYGEGMTLTGVARDLLIPYNSGKEFDETKIGEHGIGWYSVVDLAQLVKVSTINGPEKTDCVIYREDGQWKVSLQMNSNEDAQSGTVVEAIIPKSVTSNNDIRKHLNKYLGMIQDSDMIQFNGEVINTLRKEYSAVSVPCEIDGNSSPLTLGISKRVLRGIDDSRFNFRGGLEEVLITQRGLFVKCESTPFSATSDHYVFMTAAMGMGLDFWLDVPDRATLTKGRNNIIANHRAAVLEATYRAFEDLFIDVILGDEEIMNRRNVPILNGIATVFNKNYTDLILQNERDKLSLGRRIAMDAARYGSATIDGARFVANGIGRLGKQAGAGALDLGIYAFTQLPRNIYTLASNECASLIECFPDAVESAKKGAPRLLRFAGGTTLALAGAYQSYAYFANRYSAAGTRDVMLNTLIGAVSLGAGVGIYAFGKDVVDSHRKAVRRREAQGSQQHFNRSANNSRLSSKELLSNFFEGVEAWAEEMGHDMHKVYRHMMSRIGLYGDMEERRERKYQKRISKITKKYCSSVRSDEFTGRIVKKKIIPATCFIAPDQADAITVELFNPKTEATLSEVKLSIEDIVSLELQRRLVTDSRQLSMHYYSVDPKHPLVAMVLDRSSELRHMSISRYDIKLFEDNLDVCISVAKYVGLFLYAVTPIGLVHLLVASRSTSVHNPLTGIAGYDTFRKHSGSALLRARTNVRLARDWYQRTHPIRTAASTALNIGVGAVRISAAGVVLGAKAAYSIGMWCGENILLPCIEGLNPRYYPEYALNGRDAFRSMRNQRLASKERRRKAREDKKRIRRPKVPLHKRVHDWYLQSSLHRYFHHFSIDGGSFHNVKFEQLQHIVQTVGYGREYLQYGTLMKTIDGLLCDVTGTAPHQIVYCLPKPSNTSYLWLLKDKTISLDLRAIGTGGIYRMENGKEPYYLLDQLLHHYTAVSRGTDDDRKDLRDRFFEHLTQHGISFEEKTSFILPHYRPLRAESFVSLLLSNDHDLKYQGDLLQQQEQEEKAKNAPKLRL